MLHYLFGFVIVITIMSIMLWLCRLWCIKHPPIIESKCPNCNGDLHYNIMEEQTENGLHKVFYWCPSCGWNVVLPPSNTEAHLKIETLNNKINNNGK